MRQRWSASTVVAASSLVALLGCGSEGGTGSSPETQPSDDPAAESEPQPAASDEPADSIDCATLLDEERVPELAVSLLGVEESEVETTELLVENLDSEPAFPDEFPVASPLTRVVRWSGRGDLAADARERLEERDDNGELEQIGPESLGERLGARWSAGTARLGVDAVFASGSFYVWCADRVDAPPMDDAWARSHDLLPAWAASGAQRALGDGGRIHSIQRNVSEVESCLLVIDQTRPQDVRTRLLAGSFEESPRSGTGDAWRLASNSVSVTIDRSDDNEAAVVFTEPTGGLGLGDRNENGSLDLDDLGTLGR